MAKVRIDSINEVENLNFYLGCNPELEMSSDERVMDIIISFQEKLLDHGMVIQRYAPDFDDMK